MSCLMHLYTCAFMGAGPAKNVLLETMSCLKQSLARARPENNVLLSNPSVANCRGICRHLACQCTRRTGAHTCASVALSEPSESLKRALREPCQCTRRTGAHTCALPCSMGHPYVGSLKALLRLSEGSLKARLAFFLAQWDTCTSTKRMHERASREPYESLKRACKCCRYLTSCLKRALSEPPSSLGHLYVERESLKRASLREP